MSEYRVLFEGQTKARGAAEAYEIDLLAPAQMVVEALAYLRKTVDATKYSNVEVNAKWGKKVGRAVETECKMALSPHSLRGITAGTTT